FTCSDAWICHFVFHQQGLHWVIQKPTKAAQKIPVDADILIWNSWLRQVLTCHDGSIRQACFKVNMDQTQVMLIIGGALTFKVVGSKQVPSIGMGTLCDRVPHCVLSAANAVL
ncbi:hypothetical protein C8J56DRAFT_733838, partial [Mycena floridula]